MSDDQIEESSSTDDSAAKRDSDSTDDTTAKERYARRLNDQGVCFVTSGRPHLAVRCFRRACVAWPLLAPAWTNLVATLLMLGRGKDAMLAIHNAIQLGAISRSDVARYRTAIRENVSPEQLVAHRHRLRREKKDNASFRRPRAPRKVALRKKASVYVLLRTAAYNMICEGKIPAA